MDWIKWWPFRVNPYSQIIEGNLQYILTNFFGIFCIIRECLGIGNHKIDFIEITGILQSYAILQGPNIMTDMKMTRRTIPC